MAGFAAARVTIDLAALADNWRKLAGLAPGSETSGVLKADAYGLGAIKIAKALAKAGCRTFFVACPQEGIALRKVVADARIFVLGGLSGESASDFAAHGLIPVLNHFGDLEIWRAYAALPCALHFDTGMNRLGFEAGDAARLSGNRDGVEIVLVMSHLACGDVRGHAMNQAQLEKFGEIAQHFPAVKLSLANSSGVMLGAPRHFDLTRPGIALFGGAAMSGEPNLMTPVASLEARILQIRQAKKGETVGYNATQTLWRNTVIAVAGAGYADGILRSASGKPGGGGFGWFAGYRVPVLGRISMDFTTFDVTDVPSHVLAASQWVEFFGKNAPLDDFSRACGTISYEVLTGMGARAERIYTG